MPVRKRKDTSRFQGYYVGADGKQRSKDFDRMGDAKRWVAEQERKVNRGEWTDPNAAKVTVDELWQKWLATRSVKPSTREGYEEIYRSCIKPEWGGHRIDRITPSEVQAWRANMRGKPRKVKGKDGLTVMQAPLLSAGRRRKAYGVLASILDMAVVDGRLTRNPVRQAAQNGSLPKVGTTKRHQYLTPAEVFSLGTACGELAKAARLPEDVADCLAAQTETLVLLLANTGLRWGEATALRVRDVEPIRSRIHVVQAYALVKGVPVLGTPKTHHVRQVPVPAFLRDQLTQAMAGKSPDDLLFANPNGSPLDGNNFRKRIFKPAAKSLGHDGLTPHGLRHVAASLAVTSGATVKGVQRMLGHADASMTLNTYADLFDGELDGVAVRMNAAFLNAQTDSGLTDANSVIRLASS